MKLKLVDGMVWMAATLCATIAVTPAHALFEGKTKGIVKGGAIIFGVAPQGILEKCKTITGTDTIKKAGSEEPTKLGQNLDLELNLEGQPHSKTVTGKCEMEVVAGTFLPVKINNPISFQLIQLNKGEVTNLAVNLEKTLKMYIESLPCELRYDPVPNQHLTKTTIANNGTNLKIAPEVKGITSEAIGAGCSIGGIKGGKEGSIALNTGEVLEAKGIKQI